MIIAYTSAVANPTFSQADAEIAQATLTTTQNVYGGATDTADPTATFTFSWHLLQKPSGSNAALSATNVADITLNSIDTWGNYRLFLIATNTATNETSETDFLKAPNSAFVHVRVNSTNLGLEKVAPGERDWHTRAWEWVSAVDTMDATVDAIDTRVTTLEGVTPGSFAGLTDTNFAGLSNGHVPVFTGTEWENQSFLGKLTYKGTYNATTATPDLTNALKGDFYIISVAGTQFSKDFEVGDHLVVNEDMGGTLADAKVDKLDSTDAVSSVAGRTGAVTLAHTDITGLSTVANTGAYSDLTGTPTLGTAAALDTGLTIGDIPVLIDVGGTPGLGIMDGSNLTGISGGSSSGLDVFTATSSSSANANTAIWFTAVSATSCTLTLPLSSGLSDGDTVVAIRARDGELVIQQNGGDSGSLVFYGPTAASSHTLTNNNQQMTMRWNGSNWFIFDQATGTAANLDVGTTANKVVQLDGSAKLPAVDGSQLTNLPSAPVTSVNGNTGVVTVDVLADTTPQLGGDLDVNGQSIVSVSNGDIDLAPNGTGVIKTTGSIEPDADLTRTIGTEALRYLTAYTDIDGAIRFKAKNDSGGLMTKGQVVYIKGISGSVPTVDLARSNSASTMPAFGLVHANANDQAEVTIITLGSLYDVDTTTYSLSVGDTVYVSSATAGALTNSPPTGESNLIQNIGKVVRADASAGIIKVGGSGRSAATPNLDTDKVFLGDGSNQAVSTALSAINLSSLNQDLTTTNVSEGTNQYFTTGRVDTQVATLPMSTLSDVSYTGGAGIDNYVLTYDHSTSTWGAEAAAGGGGSPPTVTSASPATDYTISTYTGLEEVYLLTPSANIAVNLPAAASAGSGYKFQIKNLAAAYSLTVTPASGTIDASATYVINSQYASITLITDGTNWFII